MFVIKRNQIIVTALAVMIAVAGYLNFTENKSSQKGDVVLNLAEEGDNLAVLDTKDIYPIADDGDFTDVALIQQDIDIQALGESDPITAQASNIDAIAEGEDDGTAVFVNSSGDTQYFVQAKLDREQARAKQKDMLTEMINNKNLQEDKKAECADSMLELQQRIEKETAAEAMIESKGFSEVYVRIDDETVDVVVNKKELTEAELAQIEDIVKRKTGFDSTKIRISPLKSQ